MIIVNLKGGMGNQMFQYAAGYALSKKLGCELKIDERYLLDRELNPSKGYTIRRYDLDVFGIEKNQATQADLKRFGLEKGGWRYRAAKTLILSNVSDKYQYERKFGSPIRTPSGKSAYLDGYWQSEGYFAVYESDIRRIFHLHSSDDPKVCMLANSLPLDAVCVNVRRGDFIGSVNHDVVGLDYYMKAADKYREDFGKNPKFYVFSDDPLWCEKNLRFLGNPEIVDHSYAGRKFRDYFYLMTQFKNFIIPNSTFAWWAAWTSASKSNVIAPRKWSGVENMNCAKIVPKDWFLV